MLTESLVALQRGVFLLSGKPGVLAVFSPGWRGCPVPPLYREAVGPSGHTLAVSVSALRVHSFKRLPTPADTGGKVPVLSGRV